MSRPVEFGRPSATRYSGFAPSHASLSRPAGSAPKDSTMTIKEQAVLDAMERVEAFANGGKVEPLRTDLRTILAALKAHPLEQQQTVSGDVVERAIESVTGRPVQYENDELTVSQVRRVCAALTASGVGRMREMVFAAHNAVAGALDDMREVDMSIRARTKDELISAWSMMHDFVTEHQERTAFARAILSEKQP